MRTALVYDFDGTLARGNMQDTALLPQLGVKSPSEIAKFWKGVMTQNTADDGDHVLAYLRHLVEAGKAAGKPITRKMLNAAGKKLSYFEGVPTWFKRINSFGRSVGLDLEHYVVSAGNREIVEGSEIHGEFRNVFGCKYHYDENGEAVWPSVVVNYTTKTQFLFRINKGIDNYWNHKAVNEWMPEQDRPIPFSRMIFIGDGDTDIPSFKMMLVQGGTSIAVFDPSEWKDKEHRAKTHELIAQSRVHFVAPADYTENSELDVVVRGVLDRIARGERVHPKYFAKGRFGAVPERKA
jgi:phosphoserine phosphatase